MDKKFVGIIAAMLVVCLLLINAAALVPQKQVQDSTSAGNSRAVYVDRIFDKNRVLDVYISIKEADFKDMLANPMQEEYKQASVVVNGQKVDNVGFRVKGNSSLSSVARSKSERYSFKLDMDQYLDGQNLLGLTKLNLNNSFSDPSLMREYLSYSLLQEMGIYTPAFSYANLYVNGELLGLYLAVEGIEEPFLERYYGNSNGNLYKPEGQGSDLVYKDENMDSYSGITPVIDLKNGADAALLNMLRALNQGQDLDKYLDTEEILKYFAVNNVLVNMDSYLGNFTHNYYLYEQDGKFSILPWDYNMSFGGFGMGGNQNSTSLQIDQPVSGTTLDQRPLLGKLLEVEEYKDLYHKYVEEFVNGPFSLEKMQPEIERVAAMIRPYLAKDPTKFYTMEQFEQAIGEGLTAGNTGEQGNGEFPPGMEGELRRFPAPEGQEGIRPNNPEMRAPQEAGRMMQGASIGLTRFVRERVENIKKQLNGELAVSANSGGQINGIPEEGWMERNRRNRQMPLEGMQPPPEGMQPPNGIRERNFDPGRQGSGQYIFLQQYYLLGGSTLLLVAILVLVFKRKTKYSL